jgi:hypothetical protein
MPVVSETGSAGTNISPSLRGKNVTADTLYAGVSGMGNGLIGQDSG